MVKKFLFLILSASFSFSSAAQDVGYARMLIDSLASPQMFGRGYANKGDSLAAAFISAQFSKIGLQANGRDYYQPFVLDINTFPENVSLKINNKSLEPGKEFVVSPGSHADKGIYRVRTFDRKTYDKPCKFRKFRKQNHSDHYIFYDIDTRTIKSKDSLRIIDSLIKNNSFNARGAIFPKQSVSWHSWARPLSNTPFTTLDVKRDQIPIRLKEVAVDVDNVFLQNYTTRNVIGFISGRVQPDTFLVITAHYDHLGLMGKSTYFPGANDNASGTAMLIDLARHFRMPQNQPYYSMAFMAFSGEEAGLRGSKFYTENPLFPLNRIKFLLNLDMVGTGSDGLLVFNATADTTRAKIIEAINAEKGYVKEIRRRGESRSSDHYYFHQNKVPAFFLLTVGSEHRFYHDLYDRRESLTLSKYKDVFSLITDFLNTF